MMKCFCGGDLEVTHTYQAGRAKTQQAVCLSCKKRMTLATIVMGESSYGQGAYALAKKLERGYKVEVKQDETQ